MKSIGKVSLNILLLVVMITAFTACGSSKDKENAQIQ